MKIIEPYFEILHMAEPNEIYRLLELAARNCYKSEIHIENKITEEHSENRTIEEHIENRTTEEHIENRTTEEHIENKTTEEHIENKTTKQFLQRILKSGHESVIEHISITVRIVCDRGVLAELTRHRLASFSVESTRYANYSKDKFGNEITVIKPFFWKEDSLQYLEWEKAMKSCEDAYMALIKSGAKPQEARSVLPNSLKTDIIITANIREWRHIFKLRCSKASHPQMREIMVPLLAEFNKRMPVLFGNDC